MLEELQTKKRGSISMQTRVFFPPRNNQVARRTSAVSLDRKMSSFSQAVKGWQQKSEVETSIVPTRETPEPQPPEDLNLLHPDDSNQNDKSPKSPKAPSARRKFDRQFTLQKVVDPKYVCLSNAVDEATLKENICRKKECLSNDNPHRHQIKACKDHPYCIADPLQEEMPIHTRLPEPLPVQERQFKKEFYQEVERGAYGETGPQRSDLKTVVTQYSLDHYWAQQWNLNIDDFPSSLPEPLLAVQKLFYNYGKRGVAMNNVKGGSKMTLAKKLRQWSQAAEDKKQNELEIMYIKNNDPRLREMLEKKYNYEDKKQKRKEAPLGKYSDLKHFKLKSGNLKDMIPISYPKTMKVKPVIEDLEEEFKELIKKQKDNPGQRLEHTTEQYYIQKRLDKTKEYKEFLLGQRLTANKKAVYVTNNVKKRMESEYLNSFMQQMEIQEIAERHDEFQKLLAQRKEQAKLAFQQEKEIEQAKKTDQTTHQKKQNSDAKTSKAPTGSQLAMQHHVSQTKSRSFRMNTIQSQQQPSGTADSQIQFKTAQSNAAESVRGKPNLSRFKQQRPMTGTIGARTTSHRNQNLTLLSTKNTSTLSPRPRLFSSNKEKSKHARKLTMQSQSVQDAQPNEEYHALIQSTPQSNIMMHSIEGFLRENTQDAGGVQSSSTMADKVSQFVRDSRNNQAARNYQTQNLTDISSSQITDRTQRQLKTYTITVRPNNHKRAGSDMPRKEQLDLKYASQHDGSFAAENYSSVPKDPSYMTIEDGVPHAKVFTDIFSADQSEKGHLQKVFRQAKWQSEKDQLVKTMAYHLQKHKPVVRRTGPQELKMKQLRSHKVQGQSILQKRLAKRYGMSETAPVSMPEECRTFLSEVDTINANKVEQDEKIRKDKMHSLDVCRQQALLQNIQSQSTAVHSGDAQVPVSNTSAILSSEQKVEEGDKTTLETEFKVAPEDIKPDVEQITQTRIQDACGTYIDRVMNYQKQYKANQANQDDPFASESASVFQSTKGAAQSTSSPTREEKSKHQPKQDEDQPEQHQAQSQHKNQRDTTKKAKSGFDYSEIEPSSPGFGCELTGFALRQAINNILSSLDDEIDEQPHESQQDMELTMPEFEWDPLELYRKVTDMDSVKFWQQRGLQQAKQGQIYAAMDYYRQGLRKIPNDYVLIYSLAVCYSQLKKYHCSIHWFGKGVELHPRWLDGLCGIALAYFNMLDFERALKFITLAKDNSKGSLLTNSKLNFEIISFIYATCLKKTQNLRQSCNTYIQLELQFQRACSRELVALMWGLILIPLSDDRKITSDHYHYLQEYLAHLSDTPLGPHAKHLLLTRFCYNTKKIISYKSGVQNSFEFFDYESEVPRLNFETYPKSIWKLLGNKSFFRRFKSLQSVEKQAMYEDILRRAEVELYGKEQVIFLNDRIGVVTSGSAEIRRHNNQNLLKPFIVKKAIEGDVIGWAEGDCSYSSSPLTWIRAIQDETEVIFIAKSDWNQLWNMQRTFPEQQIVLQKLEQNSYFSQLHMLTKYHIVYESLESKVFYPGQLIMSVHPRSPLCTEYLDYYKDGTSKFRREIDNKIMKSNHEDKAQKTEYSAMLEVITEGPISKTLQQKKSNLILAPKSTNGPAERIDEEMDSSELSVSDDSERKRRKEEAPLDLIVVMEEEDAEEESHDSNSTDYGYSHGKDLLKDVIIEKATKAVQDKIQETMQSINKNYYLSFSGVNKDCLSPPKSPRSQRSSPRLSHSTPRMPQQDENELNVQAQQSAQIKLQNTAKKVSLDLQGLLTPMHDRKAQSPEAKAKRKNFKKLDTTDVLKISAHRIPKSMVRTVAMGSTAELKQVLEFEKEIRESKATPAAALGFTQEGLISIDSFDSPKLKPHTTLRPNQMNKEKAEDANYKFLVQKQVDLIAQKNRKAKKEHKRRKQEMRGLLAFAEDMTEEVVKAVSNKRTLKRMLTSHLEDGSTNTDFNQVPIILDSARKFINSFGSKSTGLNNILLINEVQKTVDQLTDIVESVDDQSEDLLYQVIVSAVNRNQETKQRRCEPEGVHFIDSGEVLVVGKNYMPHTRLNKCDAFGMCEILRKTGPEFLGDMRAGVRPVSTFYVPYDELKKRLSIPEKIKLKTSDPYQARFEAVLNFVQTRDKIPVDKLRRF